MKKNFNWFSLIELIVWVSISLILMISIWIFVTSWMKNITIQKQILDQSSKVWDIFLDFENIFSTWFEIISSSDSWILIKSNYVLGNWSIYDFSIKTQTWECQNDLSIETKYLDIKNFNPYILPNWIYSWSYLKNEIYSWSEVIVWKWIFGNEFESWSVWTWVYLNNPSSITSSWELLFVADSGNNKILYLSWSKVYKLLDEDDGIYKPTWILYNSGILYILNNFWKELLSFYSKSQSVPTSLSLDFTPRQDLNWVTYSRINIYSSSWTNTSITWPTSTWSFTFRWFLPWAFDTVSTWSSLKYNFSWTTINLFSWTIYWIDVNNLTLSWITSSWSYYTKLLVNLKDFYYPFFTSWDDNLFTPNDNIFQTLTWWLVWNYSQITLSWSNLVLNDFISWTKLEIDENWNFVSSWSLSNIPDFESKKIDLWFKIKDFRVNKTWNLLTLKIDYYKNFDCYDERRNIVKSLIFKKSIK